MAGWDKILLQLQNYPGPHDCIRREYLRELSEFTERNTIIYYSAFQTKKVNDMDINDRDMQGFMNAVKGLDGSKGLDLILHTPGGDPNAAESIVKYLRDKFNNDIRVIVPHMAMSAGTMIACAAKEIVMGKHSSLGPIDPQFGGVSAYEIQKLFQDAKADIVANPAAVVYWQIQLMRYPPAFIYEAINAITLSSVLVKEWLESCMLSSPDDTMTVDRVVNSLNEHTISLTHARHFNHVDCKRFGLKIVDLEADQVFQDKVLSLHHITMNTLEATSAVKIIENQEGKAHVVHASQAAN